MTKSSEEHIVVSGLTMAYGSLVLQRDMDFVIKRGDIFVIMGGSGCGKSTLLRHLIGLKAPASGEIFIDGLNLWQASEEERQEVMQRTGVLYQMGALWSSMTLAENIALPLQEYTELSFKQIAELVSLKLSLVGLAGFEEYYPSEISGGMRKRAALARATALDPEILFFDEPSAGLDPVSASRLDELIIELQSALGATVVIVTHELDSIFTIGTNSIFLDAESKTITARGEPKALLQHCKVPNVVSFLTRNGRRAEQKRGARNEKN